MLKSIQVVSTFNVFYDAWTAFCMAGTEDSKGKEQACCNHTSFHTFVEAVGW